MPNESQSKKVLIVEDEQALLKTIDLTIKDKGFQTLTALDGETASELIKKEKPDLVLLDILLPRKGGMEVLREMRADEETKDIPVLLLTNLSDEESIAEGVQLGARGYFVKADLTLDEVADKVIEVLGEVS